MSEPEQKPERPEEEKEGYFLAFRNSWEKVWEYKTLWIWGALATVAGGYSFGQEKKEISPNQMHWEDLTEEKIMQGLQQGLAFLQENFLWVSLIFFVVLLAILFFLAVSAFVRGGLIRFLALKKAKSTWRKNGREVWVQGKKTFLSLLKLDLWFLLFVFVFFLLGVVLLGGLTWWVLVLEKVLWKEILGGLLLLFFLAFFLVFLFSFFIKSIADFLVVLLEKKPWEAFWEGGVFLKRKFKEFVKLLLMFLLATWLGASLFEIGAFFCQAFFSGVGLVFDTVFRLAGIPQFLNEKSFGLALALWVLALLINSLFNLFKIDYKLWWLERNGIIQPLKEKKQDKILKKEESLAEQPVVVEGEGALEAE